MNRVEVRDLMERIRKRARSAEPDEWPSPGDIRPALSRNENLAHLNRHWVIEVPVAVSDPSPRRALRRFVPQWLRSSAKRVFRDFVLASLEPYLLEEREFLAHLVKLLNETAGRLDAIESELRGLSSRSGESRGRLVAELEALRLRAEELHGAIERRLESRTPAAMRGRPA